MGKFVQMIRVSVAIDDDTAMFDCKPMSRACAVKMQGLKQVPVLKDGAQVIEDGEPKTSIDAEGIDYLIKQFEEHTLSISGATDAGGNALTKEMIFGTAYFIEPVINAAMQWTTRSLAGN